MNRTEAEQEEIEEYIKHIPVSYQPKHRIALSGKSKAAGVKAKCLDCCCWDRTQVRDCSSITCPLHPYRPSYVQKVKIQGVSEDKTE